MPAARSSASSPSALQRLIQISNSLAFQKTASTMPFDPDSTSFPSRKEIPAIPGAPPGAAWVWGKDDQLGRLNLLTPTRVAAASKEIKTGEMVPLNLPLDVPKVPAFKREEFKHEIKTLVDGIAYDDLYHLNTQSGTQWDGFRHVAHVPSKTFYNNTKKEDILGPKANHKCGIGHWANHGIAGRGVLIDYRGYAHKKGIKYDPLDHHAISWDELYKCGKDQGIDIRPQAQGGDIRIGDLLFIRSGFVEQYNTRPPAEVVRAAHGVGEKDEQRWTGVLQEEKMIDWLHDCYFAAVVGDAPAFEAWPTTADYHLHEYLLALWGVPIGEMFDLERLATKCHESSRWTFFVTSAPANLAAGVSSHANAMAIF